MFETAEAGYWRDIKGKLHRIVDMDTNHLKNVVQMVEHRCGYDGVPPNLILELEHRNQRRHNER